MTPDWEARSCDNRVDGVHGYCGEHAPGFKAHAASDYIVAGAEKTVL